MEKSVNNLILEKVDNLVNFIKGSQEYKDYIYLSTKLTKNERANDLIKRIKELQKEIVKNEYIGKDIDDLDNEIKKLLLELDKIPLYNEFVSKQEELNEVYKLIKERLDDYFYNIFN